MSQFFFNFRPFLYNSGGSRISERVVPNFFSAIAIGKATAISNSFIIVFINDSNEYHYG